MFGILGILGTGRAFVAELEEQGIGYPAFFEMLDKGPSDVLNEYAGGINGEKIFVQMNNARKQPITPAKFLALFDYDGLAEKQFQKLGNLELKDMLKLSEEDLKGMKGIGAETAAAVIDVFNKDMEEILIVSKYFDIKVMEVSAEDSDKPTVCFTGACPGYSRKELAELARGKYTVMDGVNKDLNILVCADPNSGSGKLKKAESLGIKLMSYDDFLATLNL
jgi:NAD-dependent DNA ligase